MEASANRIEPGRVISEAFSTYQREVGPLLGGALLVIGITSVIDLLLGLTGSLFLVVAGLIVGLIGQVLYTGYVVKLVQDVRDGQLDQSMSELFSAAAPFVGTLILNGILYGIAVAIGFILLIVPGLILITIWSVVAPSIVVENKGVIEAFGRSRELVRDNGWNVFLTIFLVFLIVAAVSVVFSIAGAAIGDAGRVILGTIGNILIVPVAALVSSILFFDLGGGAGAASAPGPVGAPEPVEPPEPPEGPEPPEAPENPTT
jgi:hypothetical protein